MPYHVVLHLVVSSLFLHWHISSFLVHTSFGVGKLSPVACFPTSLSGTEKGLKQTQAGTHQHSSYTHANVTSEVPIIYVCIV